MNNLLQRCIKQIIESKKIVLLLIGLGLFLETLDVTILNTAIQTISLEYDVPAVYLKFSLISYLLSLAIFIPISGWIADKFGQRNVYGFAIFLFMIGSIFCSLSTNIYSLTASRFLQGIGASMIMPVARLILNSNFERKDLISAMPYITVPGLTGTMIGPYLGGYIVSNYSWQWIFLINIPICAIGVVLVLFFIDNMKNPNNKEFDFVGFALLGFGLATAMLGLELIARYQLNFSSYFLAISVLLILININYSKKIENPLIPPVLFDTKTYKLAVTSTIFARMGFGGVPFIMPLYYQLVIGMSPLEAGKMLLPLGIGSIVAKFTLRFFLNNLGFRKCLAINTNFMAATILGLILLNPIQYPVFNYCVTFLFGLSLSFNISALAILTYSDVKQDVLSKATSFDSMIRQFCLGLGITFTAIMLEICMRFVTHTDHIDFTCVKITIISMALVTSLSSLNFLKLSDYDGAKTCGYKLSEAKR